MLLIADSGSTKCDWSLVQGDRSELRFSSKGINPFFLNSNEIEEELRKVTEINNFSEKVRSVYFYGAGISSPKQKEIVYSALRKVIPNANITVDHDLNAAAYATWQGETSITCIIGTGSNSCHFDGSIIREAVPALGYVLGDEASGAYHGKKLLRDFLYGKLPAIIHEELSSAMSLDKEIIFDRIYRKESPNVFLASFMKVIGKYKESDYVQDMIKNGFQEFIHFHVKCFEDYQHLKSHFIGSIAYYFEDELKEVARAEGVQIGVIIKKPIDNLVNYHFEYKMQELRF